jgi:hypothetical protein
VNETSLDENGKDIEVDISDSDPDSDSDSNQDGPRPCDWFLHDQMTDILLCPVRPTDVHNIARKAASNPCVFLLRSKPMADADLAKTASVLGLSAPAQKVIIER